MPDHFAILAQPRRPWLDDEALKEAFHRATAQQHPDVAGGSGENASALNAAYAVLRDPAARLRHWLELEAPEYLRARVDVPSTFVETFGKLAALHQKVAAWEKACSTRGALARALGSGERAALVDEVEGWLAVLQEEETRDLTGLYEISARWESGDPLVPPLLAVQQQSFALRAKWQALLREDRFRLGA